MGGGDIETFLSRADKLYSHAKFNKQTKLGLLRDDQKSGQILLQFVLFRYARSYNDVKQACIEYSGNRKIMNRSITNNGS